MATEAAPDGDDPSERAIRDRIDRLKEELDAATDELRRVRSSNGADGGPTSGGSGGVAGATNGPTPSSVSFSSDAGSGDPNPRPSDGAPAASSSLKRLSSGFSSSPPVGKSGYLFKWMDRSVGWGGTKWSLRFVRLDGGRLSYYKSHVDASARYVLTLKRCAVRDDGCKPNKRHKHRPPRRSSSGAADPLDADEVGAYFHVFSIYQRPSSSSSSSSDELKRLSGDEAERDDDENIIPLLRFSTPSAAEKAQWIELIADACAYCESESFQRAEEAEAIAAAVAERDRREAEADGQTTVVPTAKRGTLPPMVFGAAPPRRPARRPSGRGKSFLKHSTRGLNAARSNSRSVSAYPPSKPMHRAAGPSYLSEEAPVQNYRGLLNLGMIVLVVSNFRLILDTVSRHGGFWLHLPDLTGFVDAPLADFPFLSGVGLLYLFALYAYFVERLLSRGVLGERMGMALHYVNANAALLVPSTIVWNFMKGAPLRGSILLLHATITWMKLCSYAHANSDYRTAPAERDTVTLTSSLVKDLDDDGRDVVYPGNVTLSNLYYFWFAPTLTYQIGFPRSPSVRPTKVAGIVLRLLVAVTLLFLLAAQVISPNLKSLVRDLEKTNGAYTTQILAEYWLRLTIANTYAWLLVFYIYFHLFLNLLAELLRFGDRVFYKDWWNSSEVSAYWRLWNMPVHYWLVRHVYFPCIRLGLTKVLSTFVVFFVSAIVHELLVSVPFHLLRPWSFLGMMGQIPLVAITTYVDRKMPGSSLGNVIFWISFCVVGQPMAILLYTVDYQYSKLGAEGGAAVEAVVEEDICEAAMWGMPCE